MWLCTWRRKVLSACLKYPIDSHTPLFYLFFISITFIIFVIACTGFLQRCTNILPFIICHSNFKQHLFCFDFYSLDTVIQLAYPSFTLSFSKIILREFISTASWHGVQGSLPFTWIYHVAFQLRTTSFRALAVWVDQLFLCIG